MLLLRYIWIGLLLAGCCLPPVHGCYDMYLSPKWYLCIGSVLLWLANESILLLRGKHCFYVEWSYLLKGLTVCSAFAVVYSVCMFCCQRQMLFSGPYDNPAGLAFCVSVPLTFGAERLMQSHGRQRWILAGVLLLAVLIICCTHSRTGVLAVLLTFFINVLKQSRERVKRIVSVAFIIVCVACVTALSVQKTDSTNGRSFIIGRTFELIARHPFTGSGAGGFRRQYMDVQANYFAMHPHSRFAELADDVSHPLCEFLQVWTDYGFIGLLLFFCVLFVPFVYYSIRPPSSSCSLCGLSVPVVVFSCFSYPFHYPEAWLVLFLAWIPVLRNMKRGKYHAYAVCHHRGVGGLSCVFFLVAFLLLLRQWAFDYEWDRIARESLRGHSREMMPRYRALYQHKSSDALFLYNYAMEQFYAGEWEPSSRTAETCSQLMSSYDLELLRGDIFRSCGQYSKALRHYKRARWMCPVRFAPLGGMLMVYAVDGQDDAGEKMAQEILDKRVKVPSPMVRHIRMQAKDYLDRHARNHRRKQAE